MDSECSVPGCINGAYARGWCQAHYSRWRRTGEVGGAEVRPYVTGGLAKRFTAYVDPSGECWEWTGAVGDTGYGRVTLPSTTGYAHRVAYELLVGPIPDGHTIDHLCRNKLCVNPDHLEPVTRAENSRRAHEHRRRDLTTGEGMG